MDRRRKVQVPSKARGVFHIRLSEAEKRILEAAAAQRPEYVSTYVREVALAAAREELAEASPEA